MRQRGSGLLDAIGATVVAITLGTAATEVAAAFGMLAVVARRNEMLTAAKNLAEHALAAPCAPLPACPPGLSCSVSFDRLDAVGAAARRVSVTVTDASTAAAESAERREIRLSGATFADCGG